MRVGFLVIAMSLAGCQAYDDLPLLDVTGVDPSQIEPGGTLRIRGEGFPLGIAAEASLHGNLHRPGLPPTPVDVSVPAEVQTETLIIAPIDDAFFEAIGGRGTFDGTLRIAFRASNDRRDVFADRELVLDFLPDTTDQLGADVGNTESRARIAPSDFGVNLSREESGRVGVRVERVESESLADAQGVEVGDVLVALDGVRLYSWRDFVPDPSRTESIVLVSRAGLDGTHGLRWPHEVTVPQASTLWIAAMVLVGLLLGWLSPVALSFARPSRASLETWLTRASLVLVFAAALFCISGLQSTTVWILMIGLLSALFSLATRNRVAFLSFGFLVASTLTIMIIARSASIDLMVTAQEGGAHSWYLLKTPASTLAFGAFLYALNQLSSQTRLSASLYTAAAAVFGSALFLGGWGSGTPVEAVSLLVLKAGGLFVASRFFRVSRVFAYVVSVLGIGLALLGSVASADSLLPYWQVVASGGAVALVLRAILHRLRRPSAPVMT